MLSIQKALLLSLLLAASAARAEDKKGDDFKVVSSTKFDFSEAMIDGKMQAPSGFFLQGRQSQSLSQMVQLRPNFRNELKNSRSAVKSLVK